jgi:anti-sigma factor RsiW
MRHLEEFELNEYLDGVLTQGERTRIEAHLGACKECAYRLADLEGMFASLRRLPDEALGRDLSGRIQAALPPTLRPARKISARGWLGLGGQALAALALAVAAWQPGIFQGLLGLAVRAATLAASPLQSGLDGLAAQGQNLLNAFQSLLERLPPVAAPTWQADLASIPLETILIVVAAAGLGWLTLNILLLKQNRSKRGSHG